MAKTKDYEFTHYVDVKEGAVIHLMIENGIVTGSYSGISKVDRLIKGGGIYNAKDILKSKYGNRFKSIKNIETDKSI